MVPENGAQVSEDRGHVHGHSPQSTARLPLLLHLTLLAPGHVELFSAPPSIGDPEGQRGAQWLLTVRGLRGSEASPCSLAAGTHGLGTASGGQGLALNCAACCVAMNWSPRCPLGQFQHLAMGIAGSPGRLSLTRRRKRSFIWLLFISVWHIGPGEQWVLGEQKCGHSAWLSFAT